MEQMTRAIIENDINGATKLLKADHSLATCLITTPKLYDSGIFHWIYVGDTLLHLAAAGYRLEIVDLLLQVGANPNAAKNRRKSTPLHYASDGCITQPAWDPKLQVETIRCLIKHGANIHSQDMNGATPLHRAVRTRSAAAVKFLLRSGSDPLAKNKPGSTAFHLAVQNTGRGGSGEPIAIDAQREIIEHFLSLGVSSNLKDSRGKSVRDSIQSSWIRELIK